MGGPIRGTVSSESPANSSAARLAVAVVGIGILLDSVSTIIGHEVVTGVKEWNFVMLTLEGFVPFPVAVLVVKTAALAILILLAGLVSRTGGRWQACLLIPGLLWMLIGGLNVLTILSAI